MSMPPSSSAAMSTRVCTSSSLVVSARTATSFLPTPDKLYRRARNPEPKAVELTLSCPIAGAISRAASSRASKSRAAMAISTPSLASSRAIALPIPRLPPVMSAFLPLSSKSIFTPPEPACHVACCSNRWLSRDQVLGFFCHKYRWKNSNALFAANACSPG